MTRRTSGRKVAPATTADGERSGDAATSEPIALTPGWNGLLASLLLASGTLTACYGLVVRATDGDGGGAGSATSLLVLGALVALAGAIRMKTALDQAVRA